jgi:hypothetical protein
MPAEQSFKNHARLDPAMHFFVFPVMIFNFFFSIYFTIHYWPYERAMHLWWIVVSMALLVLTTKCRVNDLKLQDRIIRLEERLRLASLLPEEDAAHAEELTIPQLVALRFASDIEVPALVRKTLTQNLEPKAIKQSIDNWRPDHHRV